MRISGYHVRAAAAGLALSLFAAALPARADQIIELHSGNGVIGGTDSAITFLGGPADASFGAAFTAADFAAAQSGPAASIIANHSAWIAPSAFTPDTDARWISNSPSGASEGSSALYAIDFTITDTSIGSASIDFYFAVDNFLGGGPNDGLYLNGTALSGSTGGGTFSSVFQISRTDIAPLLVTGTNTLYINSTDVGGPGGLIFSATISTVEVPAPAAAPILAAAAAALFAFARRRRG